MWKSRAVSHSGIAEETVDRVEKSCQPAGIKARRQIASREARPQRVIVLALERSFRLQTTAANLAGMGRFISFKNTMMPSSERIAGFVSLLAPNAVQTSWEPEGTVLLPNPEVIVAKFQDGLLKAIPDFWETVRRAVIIGNMLVLMQVPSGNLVLSKDESRYCAWYNCDVFFFEGDRIGYVLFQRDVMYDQSQTAI